eukprot:1185523-Prorocentrum_minimum.AAC.8
MTAGAAHCVSCGGPTNGFGGDLYLSGGYSQSQQGGGLYIISGKSDAVQDFGKGDYTGSEDNYVGSGELIIKSADSFQQTGNVTIASGDSQNYHSGHVNIYSGQADLLNDDGTAGNVNIYVGDAFYIGGTLNFRGGNAIAPTGSGDYWPMGGSLDFKGGNAIQYAARGRGGNITIEGGQGNLYGGDVFMKGGDTGDDTGIWGGTMYLESGTGTGTTNSGDIKVLTPS